MNRYIIALTAASIIGIANIGAEDKKDVPNTAAAAGQLKSLVAAVRETGLNSTLKGKEPVTLFAPNDEAFKKLPEETLKSLLADKGKLKKVLMAHVVVGKDLRATDIANMNGQTVNGFTVKVTDNKVIMGRANIVKSDIACANGVIHEIDTVLISN